MSYCLVQIEAVLERALMALGYVVVALVNTVVQILLTAALLS